MKIGFITADEGGSAFYRIIQPCELSKQFYEETNVCRAGQVPFELIDKSDVMIIQRQEADSAIQGMRDLKARGKTVITDIDDNVWSIPNKATELKTFWTKERVKGFERTLEICDGVTTSTEFLAKNIRNVTNKVHVIPNLVGAFEYEKPENQIVKIGWGGSASHLPDFTEDIVKTLLKLKQEYKDKLEIIMLGITPLDLIGKSTFYRFTPPYEYLRFIRALNFDIAIIPCLDNFFNEARSNIKYLEWSAIKAATVANPVKSYREIIKHGVNGFLTHKPKQWYQYLKLLIEDKDLRQKVGQNAFDFVYENYSVDKKVDQYKIYEKIHNGGVD
jgi:glycosyltransferase involved in cell wall biosynthesis